MPQRVTKLMFTEPLFLHVLITPGLVPAVATPPGTKVAHARGDYDPAGSPGVIVDSVAIEDKIPGPCLHEGRVRQRMFTVEQLSKHESRSGWFMLILGEGKAEKILVPRQYIKQVIEEQDTSVAPKTTGSG